MKDLELETSSKSLVIIENFGFNPKKSWEQKSSSGNNDLKNKVFASKMIKIQSLKLANFCKIKFFYLL